MSLMRYNFVILKGDGKLLRLMRGKNYWILQILIRSTNPLKETTPRHLPFKFVYVAMHFERSVRERARQQIELFNQGGGTRRMALRWDLVLCSFLDRPRSTTLRTDIVRTGIVLLSSVGRPRRRAHAGPMPPVVIVRRCRYSQNGAAMGPRPL